MADADYPAIGFDPLPASPDLVWDLADDAEAFGRRMSETAAWLRSVAHPGTWEGQAAETFTAGLERLPGELELCGESLLDLAGTLARYHARLLGAKAAALALEVEVATARTTSDPSNGASDPRERLDSLLLRARHFREEFDSSVVDLAAEIRRHAEHAPVEAPFEAVLAWAGDVFAATSLGQMVKRVQDFVVEHAAFFAELAETLDSVTASLQVLSLGMIAFPGIGQALAVVALVTATGTALIDTALFAGHAKDEHGRAYVSGKELAFNWANVGLGALGIGIAAKASEAEAVASGAIRAGEGHVARFGRELADDYARLLAQRNLGSGAEIAKWIGRQNFQAARSLGGAAAEWTLVGLAVDGGGPLLEDPTNILDWKNVVAMPKNLLELHREAGVAAPADYYLGPEPAGPDLRLHTVRFGSQPDPADVPIPPPRPVMES
ncbi:MAG: hypothetical protein ACRDV9_06770 [Acidimicrobiia bacterium]